MILSAINLFKITSLTLSFHVYRSTQTRRRAWINRLEEESWMPEVSFVKNKIKDPDDQIKSFIILSERVLIYNSELNSLNFIF